MTYLSRQEIAALLQTMNGDDRRVALLCLSTGARWSEASTLHAGQVINGRVTFLKTKNGKKRTVPVSPAVEREIKTCESGPLFSVDYERFAGSSGSEAGSPARSGNACAAAHVRQLVHDEWRKYPGATAHHGACLCPADDGLRSPRAGLFTGSHNTEPSCTGGGTVSIAWLEDGRYRVDVRPRGRNGKRFCKIFDRKADAYVSQRGMMARHFFRCTSVHKIAK